MGVGRPTKSRSSAPSSSRKPSSTRSSAQAAASSSRAGTRTSGTYRPPNEPNRPPASGAEASATRPAGVATSSHRLSRAGQLDQHAPRVVRSHQGLPHQDRGGPRGGGRLDVGTAPDPALEDGQAVGGHP